MPHRCPDMCPWDMRLVANSDKVAGTVSFPSNLAVAGWRARLLPQQTPSLWPRFQILWADISSVLPGASGPSMNRCPRRRAAADLPYTGRLSWTALQIFWLPWSCGESREVRASPPTRLGGSRVELLVALALEAARAYFFFPATIAFLNSHRKTGKAQFRN